MNVTSRIEDIARRGEILIAESTRQALGAAYRLGEPRELQAPGIDELIQVHPLEQELP
jgi:class 3 adenylate cyclase